MEARNNSQLPPSTLEPAADPFKQPSADFLFGSKAPAMRVPNVRFPVVEQPTHVVPTRRPQNVYVINVGQQRSAAPAPRAPTCVAPVPRGPNGRFPVVRQPRPAALAPRAQMVRFLDLCGPVNDKTSSNIPIEQCPILRINAQYTLKVLTNFPIKPCQVAFQVRRNGQTQITRTIQVRITIQNSGPRPGHITHITFAMNEALWSRYEILRISIKNRVLMDDIVVVQDGNAIDSFVKSICLSQLSGKKDFQMQQIKKLPWFNGLVRHLSLYANLKALT